MKYAYVLRFTVSFRATESYVLPDNVILVGYTTKNYMPDMSSFFINFAKEPS